MELYSHQIKAVSEMHNGCILCGDVGTGKSRTALLYFYTRVCGGSVVENGEGSWGAPTAPRDLYIITTAKKRDSHEWISECVPFALGEDPDKSVGHIKVTVDSWNNIKKYSNVSGAFFIFDEQRVSGWGAWSKAFLKITKRNQWILLSATPGDKWSDYIPVFIANGFFKTKGEFERMHCVFSPYVDFPKIERYTNTNVLNRYRRQLLVEMKYKKQTTPIKHLIACEYDKNLYKTVMHDRWNPYDNCPIDNVGQLCYILRKVVNSDLSRIEQLRFIMEQTERAIIFYNYDYELEALKEFFMNCSFEWSTNLTEKGGEAVYRTFDIGEWNGHKHDPVPTSDMWVYLVQYNAGAEGWNCTTTDTMIFFSQNYSYRMTKQAAGRIDRLNTPYDELHYYHFKSLAPIDVAISRALTAKKNFNENAFVHF